jgi:hypothetical protein
MHDEGQLTFEPIVYIPPVKVTNPDGSITVRAGKPVLLNGDDEIGTAEAARIIGISQRQLLKYCDEGILVEGEDWRRPGRALEERPETAARKTRGLGNYRIKRAAAMRIRGDL